MHTGSLTVKRPSIGSWVSYGLGTENQNLPSFVVLAPHLPYAGTQVWSSDFLPVCHQGTRILPGAEPVHDLRRRSPSDAVQEMELDLLAALQPPAPAGPAEPTRSWPGGSSRSRPPSACSARCPSVLDLSKETDATLRLYGLERGQHRRASPGSASSPGGWPSAACGSSS